MDQRSKMKYLPQTKIKEFRDNNKGTKCPIFDISLTDAVVDHDHSTGWFVDASIDKLMLGKVKCTMPGKDTEGTMLM